MPPSPLGGFVVSNLVIRHSSTELTSWEWLGRRNSVPVLAVQLPPPPSTYRDTGLSCLGEANPFSGGGRVTARELARTPPSPRREQVHGHPARRRRQASPTASSTCCFKGPQGHEESLGSYGFQRGFPMGTLSKMCRDSSKSVPTSKKLVAKFLNKG